MENNKEDNFNSETQKEKDCFKHGFLACLDFLILSLPSIKQDVLNNEETTKFFLNREYSRFKRNYENALEMIKEQL